MSKSKSPTPPSAGDGGTPVCGTTGTCTKITSIRLVKFQFTTDHQKLLDNTADWEATGTRYPKPEWLDGRANPSPMGISHTMGQKVKVDIEFEVSPPSASSVSANIEGKGGDAYLSFKATMNISGGRNSASLTAGATLPDMVKAIKGKEIKWQITADGTVFNAGTVGQYNVYLTYAPPHNTAPYENAVTEKRMDWVCTRCSGDSSPHDSVKRIHDSTSTYDLSSSTPIPRWRIAGGSHAQCMDLSKFYQLASEMLGLGQGDVSLPDPSLTRQTGDGEVVYLYPEPGKTTREETFGGGNTRRTIATSVPAHPPTTTHDFYEPFEEVLMVDGSGGWNNFEACYKYSSGGTLNYYAGGADTYPTKEAVMNSVCSRTDWVFKASSSGWSICTVPGPSPIDTW